MDISPDLERLLTPKEAAKFLNVSASALYAWGPDKNRGGLIPYYRLGNGKGNVRFKLRDLIAFRDNCRVEATR